MTSFKLTCFCMAMMLDGLLAVAQQHTTKGYYIDKWKYQPAKHDSTNFELYENGVDKMEDEESYITYNLYRDAGKKLIDTVLVINKQSWGNSALDSFMYIYQYKGNTCTGNRAYQKITFKEISGCIWHDNYKTGYWYEFCRSFYKNDAHNNTTESISYIDDGRRRDTIVDRTVYVYDTAGRILQPEVYEGDSLTGMTRYAYANGYKKTETYYHNRSLRERKEAFFENGKLIKEIIYSGWDHYTHTNIYELDLNGRPASMTTYLDRTGVDHEAIRTRTYFYY